MSETPWATIERLCDRTDLGREETIELSKARRAIAPTKEFLTDGRWTIELSHHIHGDGLWTACIYRPGTGAYEGLRSVYPRPEARNPDWRGYPDREAASGAAKALIATIEGR